MRFLIFFSIFFTNLIYAEPSAEMNIQKEVEQTHRNPLPIIDFSFCGKRNIKDLSSLWNDLNDHSPLAVRGYKIAYDKFIDEINKRCLNVSETVRREVIQAARPVFLRRKRAYLRFLEQRLYDISRFRLDEEILEEIQALVAEPEVGPSEFYMSNELPKILERGPINQAQRAQSCSPVRLSDQYEFLNTTHSQGDMGWCFAHAAADMMTVHYQKNNPESSHRFSAVGIAIDYFFNRTFNSSTYNAYAQVSSRRASHTNGGTPGSVFSDFFRDFGLCLDTDVRGGSNIKQHIEAIEAIEDLRLSLYGERDLSEDESIQLGHQVSECPEQVEALNSIFPNMEWGDFIGVLEKAEEQNYMSRLVDLNCEGRRIHSSSFPRRDQLRRSTFETSPIDRILERGEPLYLSYDRNILTKPDYIEDRTGVFRKPHGSIIVGRRFNSQANKCEYLIKNSWGPSCSLYNPALSCENGQIWVSEELLVFSRSNVSWFE